MSYDIKVNVKVVETMTSWETFSKKDEDFKNSLQLIFGDRKNTALRFHIMTSSIIMKYIGEQTTTDLSFLTFQL